jgi:hypothetical protein
MPVGGGKGGGGDSTINVKNSGTTTLDILGLDNINSKTELILPQPFRTESTSRTELAVTQPIVTDSVSRTELAITQPIVTDSTSDLSVDIKPVAVDLCLNLNIGKIPPTCVRLPFQQHFGITLFGMEILGFNISGESRVVIEDLPNSPQIVWGGEQIGARHSPGNISARREPDGGLRIRLGT